MPEGHSLNRVSVSVGFWFRAFPFTLQRGKRTLGCLLAGQDESLRFHDKGSVGCRRRAEWAAIIGPDWPGALGSPASPSSWSAGPGGAEAGWPEVGVPSAATGHVTRLPPLGPAALGKWMLLPPHFLCPRPPGPKVSLGDPFPGLTLSWGKLSGLPGDPHFTLRGEPGMSVP